MNKSTRYVIKQNKKMKASIVAKELGITHLQALAQLRGGVLEGDLFEDKDNFFYASGG